MATVATLGVTTAARADDELDATARLSDVTVSDDGATFCRYLSHSIMGGSGVQSHDDPITDCWHLDFATGKYASAPIPKTRTAPTAHPRTTEQVQGGVKICEPDQPTQCKVITLPDAAAYNSFSLNAAHTIVAARREVEREHGTNIVTYDLTTGKSLATFTAYGDVVLVLGDTLYVEQPCAAACGGKLWNARTGKAIATVSADVAAANDGDRSVHVRGSSWVFTERGRERGEAGVLFEDVTTGKRIERIGRSKLLRTTKAMDADAPFFTFYPARGGIFVIDDGTHEYSFAGDGALIDAKGKVVKRFTAPPWPKAKP
jgi:hypothetical protein